MMTKKKIGMGTGSKINGVLTLVRFHINTLYIILEYSHRFVLSHDCTDDK